VSIGKVFSLFFSGTVVAAAATCGGHGTQESLIVSTGWLANHMKDANLIVLAVGDKSDYDAEHIAGSQFIEYRSVGVKGAAGHARTAADGQLASLSNSSRQRLRVVVTASRTG
jgi:3-mercaptopyruvate sulfurtransferase SseA